mgnify:CR=1 FL=1
MWLLIRYLYVRALMKQKENVRRSNRKSIQIGLVLIKSKIGKFRDSNSKFWKTKLCTYCQNCTKTTFFSFSHLVNRETASLPNHCSVVISKFIFQMCICESPFHLEDHQLFKLKCGELV